MKIAFLNTSLEPGRDGVGDYIRLLSEECVRQGHSCCRAALNDGFVDQIMERTAGQEMIPELRLPASLPWTQRVAAARRFLDQFAPDWVSVQFVCTGFHPKGVVFGLARHLLPMVQRRKVHVMFHEVWLGVHATTPLRHRLLSVTQRQSILGLMRRLRPRVVHTSNDTFRDLLAQRGVGAQALPLFSHAPVGTRSADDWLFERLRAAGLNIGPHNRSAHRLLGFFGSMPHDWAPEPFFDTLTRLAGEDAKKIVVLSAGNLLSGQEQWTRAASSYSPALTFHQIGPLSEQKISEYLNSLDYGLTATDYRRIGKSSAVATMLDHGLPVIVAHDAVLFPQVKPGERRHPLLYQRGEMAELFAGEPPRQPPSASLPRRAEEFVLSLQKASGI